MGFTADLPELLFGPEDQGEPKLTGTRDVIRFHGEYGFLSQRFFCLDHVGFHSAGCGDGQD